MKRTNTEMHENENLLGKKPNKDPRAKAHVAHVQEQTPSVLVD